MNPARAFITLLLILGIAPAQAEVRFVAPLEGAQLLGPTLVEVTTTEARVDRVEFRVDGIVAAIVRTPPFRFVHDFGSDLRLREISARVISNGYAKQDEATIRSAAVTAADSIDVDLVEVPLRIESQRGLKPNDLRIRENGVGQKVLELRRMRPPAVFTFVVDRSSSMGEGKLDAALRAVQAQMPAMRPGDEAQLILFNHVVAKPRPISRAGELTNEISPAGGTSLRDAVLAVAKSRRSIVIIITDGTDRNSATTHDEAIRQLAHSGMTAYAITLDRGNARGFLGELASRTGGNVTSSSAETLGHDLSRVIAEINSRYTAVYQSEGTSRGWRAIDVAAASRGVRIGPVRKGYFAE